ncbi:hypothetical protein [Bradyrhizobium sp. 604_D8_N2_3]|uniref:hypothetical protein n=1 Tax=Bradyrhizobium sp. 604_D8_N2_3 TaxID=3240370 RepID=UPI003F20E910
MRKELTAFLPAAPGHSKGRAPLPEPKPIKPRPIKDPDYAAIRKKVTTRFSKTLAYLAK